VKEEVRKMAQKKFTQTWVKNLTDSMDAHLDEETKVRLMESCGRACARSGPIRSAEACQGDLDRLLSTLAKWIGKENVQKEGDAVHIVYTKCLCHLVADGPPRLPDTYCYCSRGWLKEMFETVVGKPVDVHLLESIKRGAERCSFTVGL
jgi:predicted hydrocarbon binding protein